MFINQQDILKTPIEYLKGVGPQRGKALRDELAIDTFGDMLYHFPFRYMNRSEFIKINQIKENGSYVQLVGHITFSEIVGNGRARRLTATYKDDTGMIELVWFQGIHWFEKLIANGGRYIVYGKVNWFNGNWSITHPEIDELEQLTDLPPFMPVYPSTEKLRNKGLAGKAYAKLVQQLWTQLREKDIIEILPKDVVQQHRYLADIKHSKQFHFPESLDEFAIRSFSA
jgi:RecG-like helicase